MPGLLDRAWPPTSTRAAPTTRVLEIPGSNFAAYRWGNAVDPILPGAHGPAAAGARGAPAGLGQLGPAPRRPRPAPAGGHVRAGRARGRSRACSGVGDVVLRSDLEYERFRTPHPRALWRQLTGQPTCPGSASRSATARPPATDPHPSLPMLDEVELRTPARRRRPAAGRSCSRCETRRPIVRVAPGGGADRALGRRRRDRRRGGRGAARRALARAPVATAHRRRRSTDALARGRATWCVTDTLPPTHPDVVLRHPRHARAHRAAGRDARRAHRLRLPPRSHARASDDERPHGRAARGRPRLRHRRRRRRPARGPGRDRPSTATCAPPGGSAAPTPPASTVRPRGARRRRPPTTSSLVQPQDGPRDRCDHAGRGCASTAAPRSTSTLDRVVADARRPGGPLPGDGAVQRASRSRSLGRRHAALRSRARQRGRVRRGAAGRRRGRPSTSGCRPASSTAPEAGAATASTSCSPASATSPASVAGRTRSGRCIGCFDLPDARAVRAGRAPSGSNPNAPDERPRRAARHRPRRRRGHAPARTSRVTSAPVRRAPSTVTRPPAGKPPSVPRTGSTLTIDLAAPGAVATCRPSRASTTATRVPGSLTLVADGEPVGTVRGPAPTGTGPADGGPARPAGGRPPSCASRSGAVQRRAPPCPATPTPAEILPVAIAELTGTGLPTRPSTRRWSTAAAARCSPSTATPVRVRAIGPVADARSGSGPGAVRTAPLELAAGPHRIDAALGADVGLDVDRVVLSSDADGTAGARRRARGVPGATVGTTVEVTADRARHRLRPRPSSTDGAPFWLVLGQSDSRGLAAGRRRGDGRSPPDRRRLRQRLARHARRPGRLTASLTWTPQRARLDHPGRRPRMAVIVCIVILVRTPPARVRAEPGRLAPAPGPAGRRGPGGRRALTPGAPGLAVAVGLGVLSWPRRSRRWSASVAVVVGLPACPAPRGCGRRSRRPRAGVPRPRAPGAGVGWRWPCWVPTSWWRRGRAPRRSARRSATTGSTEQLRHAEGVLPLGLGASPRRTRRGPPCRARGPDDLAVGDPDVERAPHERLSVAASPGRRPRPEPARSTVCSPSGRSQVGHGRRRRAGSLVAASARRRRPRRPSSSAHHAVAAAPSTAIDGAGSGGRRR